MSPSGQRGGVATIGRAVMAPFTHAPADKPAKNAPNRPGKALQAPTEGEGMALAQPDNPGQQSSQNFETTREEALHFAAASTITLETPQGREVIAVPAGSRRMVTETRKAGQVIGAAQKDTTKADTAWLASFRWVQGLGVLVMLVGLIGFAHPAMRPLIGGKDTALMVSAAGLGMIVGPFLLVKYANYFVGLLLLSGAYWFISRAKHKEGQLDALQMVTNSKPPFPTQPPTSQ